jgi:antirestriction protein ArdC
LEQNALGFTSVPSTKGGFQMKPSEIYEIVTNRIINELEAGTVPWIKPWATTYAGENVFPHNAVTRRPYSGINVLLLWGIAADQGYIRSGWLTFKQAQALGAHVRKGEKGAHIVFVKQLNVKEGDDRDEDIKRVSMLKSYVVFNLHQIEELPEAYLAIEDEHPEPDRIDYIEEFIAILNIDIAHGGNRAAYNIRHDAIVMPPMSQFETPEHYYATLFHELGHATGHAKRLDRNLSGRFGTQAYAAEELIAELNSAFLCATFGIEGQLRHASYIESWLKLLKNDTRAVFTAASKASNAMSYLLEAAANTHAGCLAHDKY